ncbi:hypothetical protein GOP47_0029128 [Adiantum capillus-veneris]|nr:hypothetical protein GOP47_0029128 [Adiantum capillus-veneris]
MVQSLFEYDDGVYIVYDMETPLTYMHEDLYVPNASGEINNTDDISKSDYASNFDDDSNFLSDADEKISIII